VPIRQLEKQNRYTISPFGCAYHSAKLFLFKRRVQHLYTVFAFRAGQGVTPVSRFFVRDDLRTGRLVALFAAPDQKGYHRCLPRGVLRLPLRAFARWVQAEAKRDAGESVAGESPNKT